MSYSGAAAPSLQGRVLGARLRFMRGFELTLGDQAIQLPRSAERLMAFLGLQDRPLPRQLVSGTLWLDSSEEQSNARLRTTLWRLRRPGHQLLELRSGTIRLAREISVDVRDLFDLARRLATTRESISDAEMQELILARELLPGWYDEWVIMERERTRQIRLQVLDLACERMVACGNFAQAVAAGAAAVAEEPLRESAHRLLIKAHLAQGNRAEALRQYVSYASALKCELGLSPPAEMARLVHLAQLDPAGV